MFFSFTCECEYSDRILIQNCSAYLSDRVGRTEKKWRKKASTSKRKAGKPTKRTTTQFALGGVAVVMVGVGAALLYFLSGNPHPGFFDSNLGFLLGVFPPPSYWTKVQYTGFPLFARKMAA
jgi:hypothetical protein